MGKVCTELKPSLKCGEKLGLTDCRPKECTSVPPGSGQMSFSSTEDTDPLGGSSADLGGKCGVLLVFLCISLGSSALPSSTLCLCRRVGQESQEKNIRQAPGGNLGTTKATPSMKLDPSLLLWGQVAFERAYK